MKTKEDAILLSKQMIRIGNLTNRETVCILTNMNEPVGYAVGNSLEVIESIKFLKGEMPEDLKQVVLELGSYMIKLAGKGDDIEENKNKILENIRNGKAYDKFLELVKNQGGDISYIEDIEKFEKAKYIIPVYAVEDGNIKEINAEDIGRFACDLGAGRIKKEDLIEKQVGVVLNKKVSNRVQKGEVLAYIHSNKIISEEQYNKLLNIFKISKEDVDIPNSILDIIY